MEISTKYVYPAVDMLYICKFVEIFRESLTQVVHHLNDSTFHSSILLSVCILSTGTRLLH